MPTSKYLPIKQETDSMSRIYRKRYLKTHESEMKAFEHAALQLSKLGVNTNVDPDKVINLVKVQNDKINEISATHKKVMSRIEPLLDAQKVVSEIQHELSQRGHHKKVER